MSAAGALGTAFIARHLRRATMVDLGSATDATLDLWLAFQFISSNVALPILVATFLFSKTAKRHPILINVCIAWILSGVLSLLLFYTGHDRGPEPPKNLCIAQTSLLYGMTPAWSVVILVLVYYIRMCYSVDPEKAKFSKLKMVVLLSAPYVTWTSFSIATAILSIQSPRDVNRSRRLFYCSLHNEALSNTMQIFTIGVCIAITVIEVNLIIMLYRNWRAIRKAGHSGGVGVHLALRVLLFGLYIFLAVLLDILSILQPYGVAPDMYGSTIGLALFFTFGTQRDVLRAWAFWRWRWPFSRRRRPEPQKQIVYLPRGPAWHPSFDMDRDDKPFPLHSDENAELDIAHPDKVYSCAKYPNLLA